MKLFVRRERRSILTASDTELWQDSEHSIRLFFPLYFLFLFALGLPARDRELRVLRCRLLGLIRSWLRLKRSRAGGVRRGRNRGGRNLRRRILITRAGLRRRGLRAN